MPGYRPPQFAWAAACHEEGSDGLVSAVLTARDHFQAVGASRGASPAELCRCYVWTAVKLHPSRNAHPDAAKAFRRASNAWDVLNPGSTCESLGYSADSMTDQKASEIFAQATAECSSSAQPDYFADILSSALKLVEEDQKAGQVASPGASGLAFSAGLLVTGTAATLVGFPTIGSNMMKAALVNGSMAVCSDPSLRGAIYSNIATATERTRSIIGERSASLGGSIADCSTGLEILPCFQPVAEEASPGEHSPRHKEAAGRISLGSLVQLTDLHTTPGFNGRIAEVFCCEGSRYTVRILPAAVRPHLGPPAGESGAGLDEEVMVLRRENLLPVPKHMVSGPKRSVHAPRSEREFI